MEEGWINVNEDSPVTVTLPGYDRDSPVLSYVIEQRPQYGTLTGEGSTLLYIPHPNTSGMDQFTYTVTDGELSSETGSVVLEISAVNDRPIGFAQTIHVHENSETRIQLSGDDGDPEIAQEWDVILDSLPSTGTLSLHMGGEEILPAQLPLIIPDEELYYRAPSQAEGSTMFTFHLQDDGGTSNGGVDTSNPATITVTVSPYSPTTLTIDDVPNDVGTALSLSWTPSLSNDIVEQRLYRGVASGGPYTLVATVSDNTTSSLVDTGLSKDTTYFYVLTAFNGQQESPYTLETMGQPRDNRPVADAFEVNLEEDVPVAITLVGQDLEDNPLTYTIMTPPQYGQFEGVPPELTYSPMPDFNGLDSFAYEIDNGILRSEPATVVLHIASVNDPPSVMPDEVSLREDSREAVLDVLANDTSAPDQGETLTIIGVGDTTQGGMVSVTPDNQYILYTPVANFSGTENFTYTITDGSPHSEATAVVAITVLPVNDAPMAHFQNLQVNPSRETPILLTGDDGDPDVNQELRFIVDTLPTAGTLTLAAEGPEISLDQLPLTLSTPSLFYRAPAEGNEVATFTFHVEDDGGTANGGVDTSLGAIITVTVSP